MFQKIQVDELANCDMKSNGNTKLCYFTVWRQPWRDFEQIDRVGCQQVK